MRELNPSMTTAPGLARIRGFTFIYFAVLPDHDRFKVGKSVEPSYRLLHMNIAPWLCCTFRTVAFPVRDSLASKAERFIHRGLIDGGHEGKPPRLDALPGWGANGRSSAREWYLLDGFDAAMDMAGDWLKSEGVSTGVISHSNDPDKPIFDIVNWKCSEIGYGS